MNAIEIIDQLKANLRTFTCLLENCTEQQIKYKPDPLQWCLLEVVCHLADEEVLDFRTRCLQTLQDPKVKWPAIDPQGWVASRKYMDQNFSTKVAELLLERKNSIGLLETLENPDWTNTYQHPKIGPVSARMMLHNWLMHDYLHIRQIHRLKTEYFSSVSGENLQYAGNW